MDMELMPDDPLEDAPEASFLVEYMDAIAVVGGDESWRRELQASLSDRGLRVREFASLDELWRVIFAGESFSALIQKTKVSINWNAPSGSCFKTGDMLLLLHVSNFRSLALNDGNFENNAFDMAAPTASAEELKCRLKLLQRNSVGKVAGKAHEMVCGDYRFDFRARIAKVKEIAVSLTSAEFDIAAFLFRSCNCIVSAQQFCLLLDRDIPSDSRVLAVYMTRLRKKLALRGENGATLRAVYGRGYIVQLASD